MFKFFKTNIETLQKNCGRMSHYGHPKQLKEPLIINNTLDNTTIVRLFVFILASTAKVISEHRPINSQWIEPGTLQF